MIGNEATRLLLEHLQQESTRINDMSSADWATVPIPLDEFIKTHLDLPPLSPRQYHDLTILLGKDPLNTFNGGTPYNVMCMLAGKGSGKDYMASILITYCLYILLCMRNPQAYFGMSPGEAIDMIIVSYSQEQALQISFDKIKQRIKHWWWLRNKYTLVWGDKFISDKGKPEILVLNDIIRTHNNIRILSQHSANESFEGFNILVYVMSESSAFRSVTKDRNGNKVYSTLRTSATSRFGKRWKGMVMSFPRYEEDLDFTYQLYNSRNKDASIYGTKGAPWEFRPARFYCGGTFEWNGLSIPIEHKEEFETDPEECERKYLCMPARSGASIFTEDIIVSGVDLNKEPLLHFEQHIDTKLVKMEIQGLERSSLFVHDYLLTIDLGKAHSAAALSLQHIENGMYTQDAVGAWVPDDSKGIVIDMMDVRFWIMELLKKIPRIRVAFDQWQSLILMEELQQMGYRNVMSYHTYDRDYSLFKKAIALNKAKILDHAELLNQLKALREKDGAIRSDYSIAKRKDLVDATIGGFKILMSETHVSNLPGIIISSNMEEFGIII